MADTKILILRFGCYCIDIGQSNLVISYSNWLCWLGFWWVWDFDKWGLNVVVVNWMFRWIQKEDLCLITLRGFRRMSILIWGVYWWIGWLRLQKSTSWFQILCTSPFLMLIDTCLWILSIGISFSYWVFQQCLLPRKLPWNCCYSLWFEIWDCLLKNDGLFPLTKHGYLLWHVESMKRLVLRMWKSSVT